MNSLIMFLSVLILFGLFRLYPQHVSAEGAELVGEVAENDTSVQDRTFGHNNTHSPPRRAWARRYNGPGDYVDVATALALDSQRNVIVVGYSIEDRTTNSFDYATIKYSPTGELLWVNRYDGTGHFTDCPTAVAVDSQDNIIVTGYSMNQDANDDFATIKYSPSGERLWAKRFNDAYNGPDQPAAIAVDAKGCVYVVGSDGYYVVIKYGPGGRQLWVRRHGVGSATAVKIDHEGNVYVTGFARNPQNNYDDYITVKYGPAGDLRWLRRYEGTGRFNDIATAVAVDAERSVYVTGYSEGPQRDYDCATVKYRSDGKQLWVRRYNGSANYHDAGNALVLDPQQNVYVAGYSWGMGYDFITLKYSTRGEEFWSRRYDGPGHWWDGAIAAAADTTGNVYVTGRSEGFVSGADYAVIKYDADGNRLWVYRYNGPCYGHDEATAAVLDSQGHVYVTGYSEGSLTSGDYLTVKLEQ